MNVFALNSLSPPTVLAQAGPTLGYDHTAVFIFLLFGLGFVIGTVSLVSRLLRPSSAPANEPAKTETYECGEPAIGSSFVQFDLRFYVVALVFIVFDAEVAFLFPAATVFGKQTQLSDVRMPLFVADEVQQADGDGKAKGKNKSLLSPSAKGLFNELGMALPDRADEDSQAPAEAGVATPASQQLRRSIDRFTLYVYLATLFFFVVLFVGFAYEWKTGAFDWVRAVAGPRVAKER